MVDGICLSSRFGALLNPSRPDASSLGCVCPKLLLPSIPRPAMQQSPSIAIPYIPDSTIDVLIFGRPISLDHFTSTVNQYT